MRSFIILILLVLAFASVSHAVPVTVLIQGGINYEQTCRILMHDVFYLWVNQTYLREEKVDELNVVLCSYGGSVDEAFVIYDYLVSLKKVGYKVNVIASGHCMSAAMIILQAGDRRCSTEYTLFMTHLPYMILPGAEDTPILLKDANKIAQGINRENDRQIELFMKKTQKKKWQIINYFTEDEYFFNPKEALAIGFIDEIILEPMDSMKQWEKEKKLKTGYLLKTGAPLN